MTQRDLTTRQRAKAYPHREITLTGPVRPIPAVTDDLRVVVSELTVLLERVKRAKKICDDDPDCPMIVTDRLHDLVESVNQASYEATVAYENME